MKLLERINQSIGFTKNELRVVLFLIFAFLVGAGVKIYKSTVVADDPNSFNYSESDKTFQELSQSNYSASVDTISEANTNINVKSKKDLKLHSIAINTANKNELMRLPGIGETTAERIIAFRQENGYFKNETELLKVKGIGKKKLEQIKPYLTFN
jgi:competence ComEA-like helix-hairpin-helix protein